VFPLKTQLLKVTVLVQDEEVMVATLVAQLGKIDV